MSDKLSDNEIIKALEQISKGESRGLNIFTYGDIPLQSLLGYALDLINRQKAELDDLKRDDLPRCKDALRRANEIGIDLEKENKELKAEVEKLELLNAILLESCNGYSKACDTYKAEIERLESENKLLTDKHPANTHSNCVAVDNGLIFTKTLADYDNLIGDISVEEIKEFAERLKKRAAGKVLCIDEWDIDNLVKEMVGEDK